MATIDYSLKGLISKAIWPIAIGVLLYVAVSIWLLSGKHELASFKWDYLPVILMFSLGNYGMRFLKWQYYLRTLKLKLPQRDSFTIFMSGLGLSLTPSKLGEVVRSHFLKEGFEVPVTRSAPIVVADRLSDLVALVLLCAIGVFSYHYGETFVWAVSVGVALLFAVLAIRPLGRWVLRHLEHAPGIGRKMEHAEQLYESSATLLDWRRVTVPILLAVVAWGCEGTGFYLTLAGLGLHQMWWVAMFVYAFSTIVGAVTLLPGGLGTTEGALTGLLKVLGISTGTAALAAIIIRAATLWFGVGLGAVFLVLAERRYNASEAKFSRVVPAVNSPKV